MTEIISFTVCSIDSLDLLLELLLIARCIVFAIQQKQADRE